MVLGGAMLADDIVKALRSRPAPPDGFSEEHWDSVMRNIFKQFIMARVFGRDFKIVDFRKNLTFVCKMIEVPCNVHVVSQILDEYLCGDLNVMTDKYLGERFYNFESLSVKLQDAIMRGEIL